jgi:hypothetical protein
MGCGRRLCRRGRGDRENESENENQVGGDLHRERARYLSVASNNSVSFSNARSP